MAILVDLSTNVFNSGSSNLKRVLHQQHPVEKNSRIINDEYKPQSHVVVSENSKFSDAHVFESAGNLLSN